MIPWLKRFVGAASVAAALGCGGIEAGGAARELDDNQDNDAVQGQAPASGRSSAQIEQLARAYLFKMNPTEAEASATLAAIRSLTPAEARTFHEHVGRLNDYRGFERRAFDATFEYAQAHGKSFLDLTPEDTAFILSEVTGGHFEDIVERDSPPVAKTPGAGE
jgi:hypothetical protein